MIIDHPLWLAIAYAVAAAGFLIECLRGTDWRNARPPVHIIAVTVVACLLWPTGAPYAAWANLRARRQDARAARAREMAAERDEAKEPTRG